jgi:hypothetical protein
MSRPLLKTILFTAGTLVLTIALWLAGWVTRGGAIILFFGVEGTALLASAFTPSVDADAGVPKGFWKRLSWHFTKEASGLNYPVNSVLFYAGLICLVLSMLLAMISPELGRGSEHLPSPRQGVE